MYFKSLLLGEYRYIVITPCLLCTSRCYKISTVKHLYVFYHFILHLFVYFWLCRVFIAMLGFSLVAASGGLLFLAVCGLLIAVGFSSSVVAAQGLQSTVPVVMADGLVCLVAYGIFPNRGLNLCPLHWQVDS